MWLIAVTDIYIYIYVIHKDSYMLYILMFHMFVILGVLGFMLLEKVEVLILLEVS